MSADLTASHPSGAGDHPIRVLVVDDAVAVRRLLTMLFQTEDGIELAGIAQDGLVALEKIESLRPDIVLLDLAMPNMDGLTMLRELRTRGIEVPVVMFSTLTHHGAKETIEVSRSVQPTTSPSPRTTTHRWTPSRQSCRAHPAHQGDRVRRASGLRRHLDTGPTERQGIG